MMVLDLVLLVVLLLDAMLLDAMLLVPTCSRGNRRGCAMVVSRHAELWRRAPRGLESNPTGCFDLHLWVILWGSQENETKTARNGKIAYSGENVRVRPSCLLALGEPFERAHFH